MFDIAPSEFLLVAFVALVVIGPKDLPKAMRVVGYWVGKARGVARQFRQGFDNMVREAELEEMEKRWAAENARIMAEHPATPAGETAHGDNAGAAPAVVEHDAPALVEPPVIHDRPAPPSPPISVDHPVVEPAAPHHPAPPREGAPS
ncbi:MULTISPECIES: Sec-independent protein translocase protein TatB [unclassified Sphingomonas]|jgi:sec-independent protein translocase protein TatB|uniref:Sec-independent protein translocase protein TatB n=1 Tax=unclassified Sphingomonas TaxID=196159 RepID=UPI000E10BE52|nr:MULTISPECIES: Sec-independent protein translocase protein TatB [unclassified Sphingomonas]AXJ96048.1 twin-arginine translocase subunit TatB [Sphingomonas sp. FARSPH]